MENKPLNFELLRNDFATGRSVVLFVGTGINFGGPENCDFSWDALINHLFQYVSIQLFHSDRNVPKVPSALLGEKGIDLSFQRVVDKMFPRDVKTTIIKQTLGNSSYLSLVQDFLYAQCTKQTIEKACEEYVNQLKDKFTECTIFHTLFCIADLILRNKNIRAVVTQNYDQFLFDAIVCLKNSKSYRTYLNSLNLGMDGIPRDITPHIVCDWDRQGNLNYGDINIYHVHGFIPRYDEIQAPKGSNHIVLSMDEFYEDSRNVYSWQIASQLHFLSQYTCVFCGLSLEDYTNQRLLHYAKGKNRGNLYYLSALSKSKNVSEAEQVAMDKIKNMFHTNNGLTVVYDELGFGHLYKMMGELQYEK